MLRPSSDTVRTALQGVSDHGLSFRDSMLWAVENRLSRIYSEDFQDGQVLGGVRFRNPPRSEPPAAPKSGLPGPP